MTTKHSRRPRNFDYMRWVKSLPCLLNGQTGAGDCDGVVEADHAGERAGFRRAPDETCIPLCSRHHRDRHQAKGFFEMMSVWQRLEWRREAIERTQSRYHHYIDALDFL